MRDQGQNMQRLYRRVLSHLFFCSIVQVIGETRHVRMVWGIVPTFDQATSMVLPMMTILRHNDSPRLHFEALGQLQEIAIAQRQAVTHKAYLACGILFLPNALYTSDMRAGQDRHKDLLTIVADSTHCNCSSSRRSVCAFRS